MVTIQIWTNRLLKEFDGIESRLPEEVTLSSHAMDPQAGVCKACFEASLTAPHHAADGAPSGEGDPPGDAEENPPAKEGVDDSGPGADLAAAAALEEGKVGEDEASGEGKIDGEAPGTDGEGEFKANASSGAAAVEKPLRFRVEMDLGLDTRYPFESPVIRVLEGDDVIPTSVLSDDLLMLPDSDAWTPSSTIVTTLQDIVDMVLRAREAGLPTGSGRDVGALERGDLSPGSLVSTEDLDGCLFACTPQAVASMASGMSMLASRGNSGGRGRRPLDRYVGVTDKQVLELEAHRTRLNQAVVVSTVSLTSLKKLKFRRGASVTLVLKSGESTEFFIPQSYECVTTVTERLQKLGIAGHQTTAGAERQVDRARSIMEALKSKEAAFGVTDEEQPSLGLVGECMDMFRQAAELYSAAGDPRHEEVLTHMHEFLQRPEVIAVLEETRDEPEGDGEPSPDLAASSTAPMDAKTSGTILDESTPQPAPSSAVANAVDSAEAVDAGEVGGVSGAGDISADAGPGSPEIEAAASDRSLPAGGSSSPEQPEKEPESAGSAQVMSVKTSSGNSGSRSRSASSSSSTASSGRRVSSSGGAAASSRSGGRLSSGASGSRSSASPRSRVAPGGRTLGSTGTSSGSSSSSSKRETVGSSKGSKADEGGVGGQGRGRGRGRAVRGGGVRGGRARTGESGGTKRMV